MVAGTPTCSLDSIEVESETIEFYKNQDKLRARIQSNWAVYDLSIPADAARSRFQIGGIHALQEDAKASQRIHVRLGLARPFPAKPDCCYAQINGLYFLDG